MQSVLNGAIGLVGLFFITRYFPVSWDIISFGIGFVGIFTFISDLGYSQAYIRGISSGESEAEANSTYLFVKFVLGGIFIAITISSLFIITDVLHIGFEYPIEYWVILGLIPYYFFSGFVTFFQSFYRAKYSTARYAIPTIAEALARNSIFILIGAIGAFHLVSLTDIFAAVLISITYDATYSVFIFLYYLYGRPWKLTKFSLSTFKSYTKIALPMSIVMAVAVINGNVDKVIIQFFWHGNATGGFYLDQRIATVLSSFATSLTIFFLPILSSLHKNGTAHKVNNTVNEFEKMVLIIVLPFAVTASLLSYYIVNIFNATYLPYAIILAPLSISAVFGALVVPSSSALIAKARASSVAKLTSTAVILNIALNLVLIPPSIFGISYLSLGALGGGVSSLVANIFLYAGYRVSLYRTSKTSLDRTVVLPVLPAMVQSIFLLAVIYVYPPLRIYVLVPVSVTGVLIFMGVTVLTKQLKYRDLMVFVRNLLNPFHITNSLKTEKRQI
jgi:O-antigen/teichoic acid export membrane protein